MNLDAKKDFYELIIFLWTVLKTHVFVEKPDFDSYVKELSDKWNEFDASGNKILFELYKEMTMAISHYIERC